MSEFDPHAAAVTGTVQRLAEAVWRIVAPNPGPLTGPVPTPTWSAGSVRS